MSSTLGYPTSTPEELLSTLERILGDQVIDAQVSLGDAEIRIAVEKVEEVFTKLKNHPELQFNLFVNVTAVDWMDDGEERYEMVYHLRSLSQGHFLRIRAWVPEEEPQVKTLTSLWVGADFMEREVYDMYGIRFIDHPDLTRILMYEEFKGYPLRKDYPVQGKQPRIPLRHPEVENTARLMERPDLVSINKRPKSSEQSL